MVPEVGWIDLEIIELRFWSGWVTTIESGTGMYINVGTIKISTEMLLK